MTVTAESIRADFLTDVNTFEAESPRSQQVETGASQLYGCVAEAIYRLRGTELDVQDASWAAVVGKAIHGYLEEARAKVRTGVIPERRFVYRNVPATVDYIDPAQHLLIDYKSKETAAEIADLLEAGERPSWRGQVMLGAAAAREAGYRIDHVAIVVLPRNGNLDDVAVLGPWEFDEQEALEAAMWANQVDDLAADPDIDPRDHRGQPYFFCRAYCPFFSKCRGEEPAPVELDDLAAPGEAYREAQDSRDAAVKRMEALRPVLFGAKGRAGRVTISTSQASSKDVEVEDVDAMRELALFVNGEVPTKTVSRSTSARLTVKWAKDK